MKKVIKCPHCGHEWEVAPEDYDAKYWMCSVCIKDFFQSPKEVRI